MKNLKTLKQEELVELVETLAYRIAVAEGKKYQTIDEDSMKRVLKEEGIEYDGF